MTLIYAGTSETEFNKYGPCGLDWSTGPFKAIEDAYKDAKLDNSSMTVLETVILGNEKHLRRTFTTNDGEVDLYTISTDRDIKIYQESDLAHLLIQRCEGRNSFGHPSSGFIEQILRKLGRPAQRMQRARPELH